LLHTLNLELQRFSLVKVPVICSKLRGAFTLDDIAMRVGGEATDLPTARDKYEAGEWNGKAVLVNKSDV
jgi:hypothetical protein